MSRMESPIPQLLPVDEDNYSIFSPLLLFST